MSKHETSNQFKDGLMMDVHPLQTPNTVLTDCLNGTFITYNGNEHVLQNDMGNFKLSKCKLKENYIPVGTASYGDILYIASYNPIDKKFELGSYPSPLQWNALSDDSGIRTINSVIDDFSTESEEVRLSWLEMTKSTQTEIFDDPGFKLCPGDEYLLEIDGASDYDMEKLNYYILDENNVKHEITIDSRIKTPVSWETPGHLCIERSVMTPFEHSLSLRKAVVGNNIVTYSLRSILTIQDEQLCKLLDETNIINQFVFEISALDKTLKVYSSLPEENTKNNEDEIINFKFDSIKVFPWLNEKRQIVADYTIMLKYKGGNALVVKEDNKEPVYNNIITTITVLPTFLDKNGITILYDNLQQSISYSASGNNFSSAATKFFTWNRKADNDNNAYWEISFDVFKANANDSITYELSKVGGGSIDAYTIENNKVFNTSVSVDTTIRIAKEYDDSLICLILTIEKESGEIIKNGRFAFLDTSGVIGYTPLVRMDTLFNIQDVLVQILDEINITAEVKDVTPDKKLTFNHDEFDVVPDKHTVWFDNVFNEIDLSYSQKWTGDVNVTINSDNKDGIWSELQITSQTSNDKQTTSNTKWELTKTQEFSVDLEQSSVAYIPFSSVDIIDWGEYKELAWDQNGSYDAVMRIHEGNTKGKYSQSFDNSKWSTGTNHALWRTWLKRKENWLFKSIYAYKWKNGGNNYYITNIGWARNKGRNGIDGSHIAGFTYGSTTPEIIMTKYIDNPIRNHLAYVTIDPVNKLQYWKNRYLYKIDTDGKELLESSNKVFVRYSGSPGTSDILLWLFNSDKNKLYDWYPGVEFDSQSKMEWLSTKWTDFKEVDIEYDSKGFTMKDSGWNKVVETVQREYNTYSHIYDRMTELAINYHNIPVNCMQWHTKDLDGKKDLSSKFPICCIYDQDSKKISFNASLATLLGEKYSQHQSYFQINYSGTIKTNLGPLNIIKYGF